MTDLTPQEKRELEKFQRELVAIRQEMFRSPLDYPLWSQYIERRPNEWFWPRNFVKLEKTKNPPLSP
jgi:hypothetical protein